MEKSVFISGEWIAGEGDTIISIDPSDNSTVWQGRAASINQVENAVQSARTAFYDWRMKPLTERITILKRYATLLEERAEIFAQTICSETGKPIWEGLSEVGAMQGKVSLSIRAQAERAGEHKNEMTFGQTQLAHRPHGVMAVFGPFNFPGHLPNGHIIPAILAGNTIVFKPSEQTPATANLMIQTFVDAGLPEGVLNLVQGAIETGTALLEADINGVLFTGSSHTGTLIHRKFGGRPDVILSLEMGGNNPLIIWPSADTEASADIAVQSAFLTSGQRCSCARRLVLPDDNFGHNILEAIQLRVKKLNIGSWRDGENIFMGPLISASAVEQALSFQNQLKACGGRIIKALKPLERGDAYVSPGVIDMSDAENPPDQELFGPLLQVWRVTDLDTAITCANATRFGLSAGLVSDDDAVWDYVYPRLNAGILNRNRPTAGASGALPFGGSGYSGNHRPSAWYAADYCAWPVASQIARTAERQKVPGFGE